MTPHELPDKNTPVPEDEYILTAAKAWKRFYGHGPRTPQLACCLSQMVLETGRKPDPAKPGKYLWGCFSHNFNVGNIKSRTGDGCHWQHYACGEEVSLQKARELISEDPVRVSIKHMYGLNGNQKASVWFLAPHPWTCFRAYETLSDGLLDYLDFLVTERDRYLTAWNQGVLKGDPVTFSLELGKAGYYTADPKRYTPTVVKLFNEFEDKVKAILESPEGQETYSDEDQAEKDRILALTDLSLRQSYLGAYTDPGLDEDAARAAQAPNVPSA